MSLRFQDKVAIVTGGCSGIGKGCAEVLVEQGGIVVILDKAADETSPTLPGPGKVKYMQCDVTNEDQVKSCIEQTVTEFGKIDCLVNNAGVHTGVVTIDTISVDDFKTLFDINVISMFIMSKHTLPYLRKTKGSIVNISSFSGEAGQAGCSTYCATKGAVTSFAKGLAADEAKNGVRVNTICPGPTNTPLLKGVIGDTSTKSDIVYDMLLGRFGEPREIGLACLYLAVDATFSTGATLMCTGGAEIGYGLKYRQELLLPERTDGNQ